MDFFIKLMTLCHIIFYTTGVMSLPPKSTNSTSSKSNLCEEPRDLAAIHDIPYQRLEIMFTLMHLGHKKESQKPQDSKTKAEGQKIKNRESAGGKFFGIHEMKYGTFDEMSINQLGQMADAGETALSRDTSINVRVIITKRIFKHITDFRQNLPMPDMRGIDDNLIINKMLDDYIEKLTNISNIIIDSLTASDPKDNVSIKTCSLKILLLFKFFAAIGTHSILNDGQHSIITSFVEQMTNWDEIQSISGLLTVNDHKGIIKFIDNGVKNNLKNLVSLAHFEIVKRSRDYLKKKMPFLLINKIFDNTIEANAEQLMKTLLRTKADTVPKYEPNCSLDWAMYHGKSVSKEDEKRFYLDKAKPIMRELTENMCRFRIQRKSLSEGKLLILYKAYLIAKEISAYGKNVIDECNLNFALFEIAAESNPSYKILLSMLEKVLSGSKTLERSFSNQLKAFNKLAGTNHTEIEYYVAVFDSDFNSSENKYIADFRKAVYKKILEKFDELSKATDLSPFIELAETVRCFHYRYLFNFKTQLYNEFFKFANRPEIFKDIGKLERANQLHVELLVDTNYNYYTFYEDFNYSQLSDDFFKKFDTYLKPSDKDDKHLRFKQMICLKFYMNLMQRSLIKPESVTKGVNFYDEMMRRDGEKLCHDDEVLHLAIDFFRYRRWITNPDHQLFQPLSKSKISPKNPLAYLQLMAFSEEFEIKELPAEIINNILAYESNVGDAINYSSHFYFSSLLVANRNLYLNHVDELRQKEQSDLNKFIEKMLSLSIKSDLSPNFESSGLTFQQLNFYENIFNAIFAAIEANPDAERQLELETVLNVDRAVLDFRYDVTKTDKSFHENIKSGYDEWQTRWKKYVSDNEEALKQLKQQNLDSLNAKN